MDVVAQPPRAVYANQTLPGSIIVRLRTTNVHPIDAIADSINLVAVATLTLGSTSTTANDVLLLNSFLAGRRFDSIHPFSDDIADSSIVSMDTADPSGVGYMRFHELVIRQPGTYRIRITLIRIHNPASEPQTEVAGNGSAVQIIDTHPIVVYENRPPASLPVCNGSYVAAKC